MFGDVHGRFKHIKPLVENERPAAIILLGDIEAPKPLHEELVEVMEMTEVFWIPGNHDTDSLESYNNLYGSALADRNLHGRVIEIDGVRVAGLGGVFREASWYPRFNPEAEVKHASYEALIDAEMQAEKWKEYRRLKKAGQEPDVLPSPRMVGKALTHKSTIFHDDWLRLCGQSADILVTHEAPSCHPYGFVAIDVLAQLMGIQKAFHGHLHDRIDYSGHFERIEFEAYGVGLRGVSNANGEMLIPGDHDDHYNRQYQAKMDGLE